MVKLNLGCGLNAPADWINIDASFTARLAKWKLLYNIICKVSKTKPVSWPKTIKTIDVRKGLPFSDGSVEAIFSSHLLEHMTYEEANFVIKECYRCLCKEGIIRVIVPDLYQIAKRYVDLVTAEPKGEHSHNFLRDLGMQEATNKGISKVIFKLFSHSRHLYMYDELSLKELLEKNGFTKIQRMGYGQSCIRDIELLEDKSRHEMSVCLEGIKE